MSRMVLFMVLLTAFLASPAWAADVPGLIAYQSTLTDENGLPLDDTVSMTFSIYDDSTGAFLIWDEIQPAVEHFPVSS